MKHIFNVFLLLLPLTGFCINPTSYVAFQAKGRSFCVASKSKVTPILVSKDDNKGVIRATSDLQSDVERVTGRKPQLLNELSQQETLIIVGTLGKNQWIDALVAQKKIDVQNLKGKWETFVIQTLENPFPNVKKALVIVGSDRRGTIYGIYDLSEQMGVSPWHFWADVPTAKHDEIYVNNGKYSDGEPKVKYRGIFLNDEAPCLAGWTKEKNGGFNQKLYTSIFELILRLKGNYLWPAMWGNAFHVDDPMNPVLADEYGVVIGTSHHEPLMRAHDEWRRFGKGKWDYTTNDSTLRAFWKKSTQERYQYDNIFTVGMRGDGDEPMSQATATALLEKIVGDQRKIMEEVSGKPASEKPQLWALYKEVQDYYDKGMRVPDDITLLLCDDNWGNIRKLPNLTEKPRKGGYGIYYHFDYVGGPRNYKWVNTNPLPRIWEQMNLAYQYKAREIWIVNVGDLKPMEFPISFFLDYAWNPEAWTLDKLPTYSKTWAKATFGEKYASEIATYLDKYAKYNARVKPELLNANTYSLEGENNEWTSVLNDYKVLAKAAEDTYQKIEPAYKDAYYQLVLYPILACANLNEMYFAQAKNQQAANAKWASTNAWADKVEELFKKDQALSDYFNQSLAGGKWNHFADQTHIGYTYWQQPNKNAVPKVTRLATDEATKEETKTSEQKSKLTYPADFKGFLENSGIVSMEADHYSRAINMGKVQWKVIPDIGRTGNGISIFPVDIPSIELTAQSPRLEYDMFWSKEGEATVQLIASPTLDFNNYKGLHLAISLDDEKPQVIDMHADKSQREWERMVARNAKYITHKLRINGTGKHTLKIWAIDPAIILQKIIVSTVDIPKTHLGPEESTIVK
ncbi:glycosyl hydrolase 115 family protein [Arcicella rigui]|uniref:Glycosyl hydrolase 115 family protein n=1 Tax=Arcicella rigui TaxID=797020 RepID=A0ABU5QFD9_9BACT|nr:glycosyl hydrolase 115 family protein [Arcicella rigui]MEA5141024.1 glycosyl hydrolase 115 family protein [Arcicella rigui]